MSRGGRVYGPGKPADLINVHSIVENEGIEFKLGCMEACGELEEFLGGHCLASSANLIAERAERFATCAGQRQKLLGGLACGAK